jgi:hypothetical protein
MRMYSVVQNYVFLAVVDKEEVIIEKYHFILRKNDEEKRFAESYV